MNQEHGRPTRVGTAKGRRAGGGRRRVAAIVVSVVVLVAIVVGVVPQFASYSTAWRHMARISPWWCTVLAVVTAVGPISGVWLYQAALPGLRLRDGLTQIATTSAIASTVPAGGTVALGMTYEMFHSFGFQEVEISTAIIVTGVWNFAAKLGLPIVAVGFLAMTTHPPRSALIAAWLGLLVLIGTGIALWLLFRSEALAHRIGRDADKALNRLSRRRHRPATNHVERSLVDFRSQTVETVHSRGWLLTGAALAGQIIAVVLVLAIVRAVGISSVRVSSVAVLTAFAVARLAGSLPVTPGGLGTIDAAFVGMLAVFGTSASHALSADLMWRLATYLFPILLGTVTYFSWLLRERRKQTGTQKVRPPS